MANWDTIHVFGKGGSQIIGPDKNGRAANAKLTTLAPLISYLSSLQQDGSIINLENLYVLTMYNNFFIDFYPNSKTPNASQRFMMADLDLTAVNDFADELAKSILMQEESIRFTFTI